MKKFRFTYLGYAKNAGRKDLSDLQKQLPTYFTLDDIVQGTFSSPILKRISSAKDGAFIRIRGFGRLNRERIDIEVLDKGQRQQRNKKWKLKKKKIEELEKNKYVQQYLKLIRS